VTGKTTATAASTATGGRLAQAHLVCVLLMFVAGYLSIAASQILLGLALALLIARAARRELTLPRTGLETTAALLALWAAAVLPFSQDPGQSLVYYRRFYLFTAVWTVATAAGDDRRRTWLLWALLAGSAGTALFSQVKAIVLAGSLFSRRLNDLFNPMTSGALLMMPPLVAAGFVLRSAFSRRKRALLALAALPVLLAMLQTMTRSALLGFVAGAAVILLAVRPRWFLVAAAVFVAAIAVVGVWGDAFLPDMVAARLDPQYFLSGKNTELRLEMWQTGWRILQDHPWLGVGDHDLAAIYPAYGPPDATIAWGHLHSNFAQMAVIWGWPGLALGATFVFAPGWLLWRRVRRSTARGAGAAWALGALGVWAAFVVAGLTEWYFGDAETMLIYLAVLGAGLAPDSDA
jgi:O-antigen ligase